MGESSEQRIPIHLRREIFQEELHHLKEKKLIKKSEYIRISSSYDREYNQRLSEKERAAREREIKLQPQVKAQEPSPQLPPEPAQAVSGGLEAGLKNEERRSEGEEGKQEPREPLPKAPVKRTNPADRRERNIGAILVTGVILLLIGGILLATSSWGSMNAILKVFCISLVSVFFAGMAFLSMKLKIRQTSFAFMTLASLFFPIAILSAAYYKIFGDYLSLEGEGRGLVGFAGGLVCLWIYQKIAGRFRSKFYIFLSMLTFILTFYFGIAYLTPSFDSLFFIAGIGNLLLMWNADSLKNRKKFEIYRPYFFQFMQFKVIVEAFVIFTLFTSTFIYSLTLLILSFVFLLIAVKYRKKYYDWAFSAVFSYGYLHLIYNSFLETGELIFLALLPSIFMCIYWYLRKSRPEWKENIKYVSWTASVFVLTAILSLVQEETYLQAFAALLIISAHFFVLVWLSGKKIYTYAAVAIFEFAFIYLGNGLDMRVNSIVHLLFGIQLALFLGYYLLKQKRALLFKESILSTSAVLSALSLCMQFFQLHWETLSAYLAIVTGMFVLVYVRERHPVLRAVGRYGFPLSLTLSLLVLLPFFKETSDWHWLFIGESGYLMLIAMMMLGIGRLLKGRDYFFSIFLVISQVLSFFSITAVLPNQLLAWTATLLLLIGTGIQVLSVRHFRLHLLWLPVLYASGFLYLSLIQLLDVTDDRAVLGILLAAPLVFFFVSEGLGRKTAWGRTYFYWFSHGLNILSMLYGCLSIMILDLTPFLYILQPLFYIISAFKAKAGWEKLAIVIAGFVAVHAQVSLFIMQSGQSGFETSFTMMSTATITAAVWMAVQHDWKRWTEWVLVPYVHLAALTFILEAGVMGFPEKLEAVSTGVATLLLAFGWYIVQKRGWANAVAVPLLLIFLLYAFYTAILPLGAGVLILLAWLGVMLLFSKLAYTRLMEETEKGVRIDVYRCVSFLYLLLINVRTVGNVESPAYLEIFAACLPAVCLIWFAYSASDLKEKASYDVLAWLAGVYAYFIILNHVPLPAVIEFEVKYLPLLLPVTVLLKRYFPANKNAQLGEMAAVFFLFILMIFDALGGDTLQDALVIGVISLASALFGFMMKYKSYFLAGIGTILLNIYMNTKSLWGSMPWWFYLIGGGLVLIAVASFFEYKKQKDNTTFKGLLDRNKRRLEKWFKKWK
ncbi:hypothetical protein [Bacillus massiliglaciei]|uniref:hypothetical protein n=1 Tax=Bacillus massiliglaciei TaxID=1816693 RepID=UPI000A90BD04|nr:hypothetical protein [Bacillus massiliglaciei]